MNEQDERITSVESTVKIIMHDLDTIKKNQTSILASAHLHEIESERYRLLLDEIIEEKRAKRARVEAITDTLVTKGVLATIALLMLLAWVGLKGKIIG